MTAPRKLARLGAGAPAPKDVALLAGRVIVGGYVATHGSKILGAFGTPGLDTAAEAFEGMGFRPGRPIAIAAACLDLVGGLATVAGVAPPLGPLSVAGTMAVASYAHAPNGPFIEHDGYELTMAYLAGALVLAAAGPGRYAVGPRLPAGLVKLSVAAGAVAGAAIVARARRARSSGPAEPAEPGAWDSEAVVEH